MSTAAFVELACCYRNARPAGGLMPNVTRYNIIAGYVLQCATPDRSGFRRPRTAPLQVSGLRKLFWEAGARRFSGFSFHLLILSPTTINPIPANRMGQKTYAASELK